MEKSRSVEDLQRVRLMALLRELARDKGVREAAQALDIDHRTLTASLEERTLSRSPSLRREYPELVPLEPADDDEAVFGPAWPLIVEWRGLKDTHPDRGKGLSWLVTVWPSTRTLTSDGATEPST